jgi:hypothetical protein
MARNTCVSGRVLGCLEPSVDRTIYEETEERYHLPCTREEKVQLLAFTREIYHLQKPPIGKRGEPCSLLGRCSSEVRLSNVSPEGGYVLLRKSSTAG